MQLASLILIRWIVIYPVDSAIQLLNNWGREYCGALPGRDVCTQANGWYLKKKLSITF